MSFRVFRGSFSPSAPHLPTLFSLPHRVSSLTVARTTAKGACSIRRVADDREIASLPALGEPATAAFGPGRLLVLVGGSSRRLQLWDLAEAEPVLRFSQRDVGSDWTFRSDGRFIALGHVDGSLSVYETDSRVPKYRLKANGITFAPFGIAAIKALICAKFVLLGRAVHLGDRFKGKPLIWPTLHRSFVFLVLLWILNIFEEIAVGYFHHRGVLDSIAGVGGGNGAVSLGGPNFGGIGLFPAGIVLGIMILPYVCAVSLDDVQRAVSRLAHRDEVRIVRVRHAARRPTRR